MTREEFEALGITPYDLVCLNDNAKRKIVGFLREAECELYTSDNRLFGIFETVYITNYAGSLEDIGDEGIAHNYETVLDWVESIEILRKDFWSNNDQ
jgi:hypothetical protein